MKRALIAILLLNQSLLASDPAQQFILNPLITNATALNLKQNLSACKEGLQITLSEGIFEVRKYADILNESQINLAISCDITPKRLESVAYLFPNAPRDLFALPATTPDKRTSYYYKTKTRCCCLKTQVLNVTTRLTLDDFMKKF